MSAAAPAFRPSLEALEDRQLMAVNVAFDPSNTVMYLTGNSRNNRIELFNDGTGGVGNIFGSADGRNLFQFTQDKAIRTIVIDTGSGNDTVTYNIVPASPTGLVNGNLSITARLGNGNDTFAWAADGVQFNAGYNDIQVFGGRGNDTINGSALNTNLLSAATLAFFAQGEDGRDSIRYTQSGFNDRLTRHLFIGDGGTGNDTVSADHEAFEFSFGRVHTQVRGGLGFDRLDHFIRSGRPETRTVVEAFIDGGVDPVIGRQNLNPRQWEDITLTSSVQLTNVDPRSRVTYVIV